MGTAIHFRCIAVVFVAMFTFGISLSSAVAQRLEGCLAGGVAPTVDYYLPNLWGNYVIVSDERRDAEQLAATFSDPADALSRLNAYCWTSQAERVYFNARDQLTVDVSIHDFSGSEGATLAQRWFGYQRANDLGLQQEVKTRTQLEEELNQAELGKVNIETLDGMVIYAFYNHTEYTLYARRDLDTSTQTGSFLPDDLLVRVSASGGPSVSGMSRQVVAYQVLARIFGVNLFPPRA